MTYRSETYSFLPPPSQEMIHTHIAYIVNNELVPRIEYCEDTGTQQGFWHQWHLPKNTWATTTLIQQLLRKCIHAHPEAFVRLAGYNTIKRMSEINFIVRTPTQD